MNVDRRNHDDNERAEWKKSGEKHGGGLQPVDTRFCNFGCQKTTRLCEQHSVHLRVQSGRRNVHFVAQTFQLGERRDAKIRDEAANSRVA